MKDSPVSPRQFILFRIILGTYLAVHFVDLIPAADALFSNQGMIPDGRLIPTNAFFPNLLIWCDDPFFARAFCGILAVLALMLAAGVRQRLTSLLLWYGWACLFNRNIFISNPGMPYVGWLLLALCLIPPPRSRHDEAGSWQVPPVLFHGAWALMAVGYTVSGIHKLGAPSWLDGSALAHLFRNPLARETLLSGILMGLPDILLRLMTWSVLAIEILFAPLCLLRRGRACIWTAAVAMHIGIMLSVDFLDLTMGMLTIHWFTFDRRWLRRPRTGETVIFFDGVCQLCNGAVNLVMSEDGDRRFRFAPLQGTTAAADPAVAGAGTDSIIVRTPDGRTLQQAAAALWIAGGLGGIFGLLRPFSLLPAAWLNPVYNLIARNRYRIRAKRDSCRLPTAEERAVFLD